MVKCVSQLLDLLQWSKWFRAETAVKCDSYHILGKCYANASHWTSSTVATAQEASLPYFIIQETAIGQPEKSIKSTGSSDPLYSQSTCSMHWLINYCG